MVTIVAYLINECLTCQINMGLHSFNRTSQYSSQSNLPHWQTVAYGNIPQGQATMSTQGQRQPAITSQSRGQTPDLLSMNLEQPKPIQGQRQRPPRFDQGGVTASLNQEQVTPENQYFNQKPAELDIRATNRSLNRMVRLLHL